MERDDQTHNRFCSRNASTFNNIMRPGGTSPGRMINIDYPPSSVSANGPVRESNSDSHICHRDAAPTSNNIFRSGGISDGRMINDNYPPSPAFANCPVRPVRKSNSASVAPWCDIPTAFIDVDKILRLKQLNDNVYLVSRSEAQGSHRATETRDEDGFQLGVVVNDPPISSQSISAVDDVPQLNEDQIPPSMQRLVLSLKRQVQNLQLRLNDVETEFQVRYQREKNLITKVNGLIESSKVTKCGHGSQVGIGQSPKQGRRDDAQSSEFPDTMPSSFSDLVAVPTTSLDVARRRNQGTFDQDMMLPSGAFNVVHTSTPLVGSDNTLDPRLMAATYQETSSGLSPGYCPDSSTSESEEDDRMNPSEEYTRRRRRRNAFSGDLARRAQKRPRHSSSRIVTLYDSEDSGNFSDFPSEHPFRYSMDTTKPPKVPANYCDACYRKIDSIMIGKFCFPCSARVERLVVAYIANNNTPLPFCDHPMRYPKRRCRGCIFKVYTYRYNRRNPTNLLPFPDIYQRNYNSDDL